MSARCWKLVDERKTRQGVIVRRVERVEPVNLDRRWVPVRADLLLRAAQALEDRGAGDDQTLARLFRRIAKGQPL